MEQILLSDKSYAILKDFFSASSFSSTEIERFPESCIEQLLSFKLIDSKIVDYDISGEHIQTVFGDYCITEYGKGYLAGRFHEEEYLRSVQSLSESIQLQATIAEQSVQSTQSQATIAEKNARSSRISSWISSIAAVITILINIFLAIAGKYC